MKRSIGQLGRIEFTNHLMFNAVLTENEGLCIRLIEAVLGKHVESVEFLDDEHTIQSELDSRGARLDVLALVDGEYVDIEMQVGREPNIARRCRFYHGSVATRYTPKSAGYASVPRSYVIFICLADPLGQDLSRYELATTCLNEPSVRVDDGAVTVLLNASAWNREQDPEVAGLLQYALTGHSDGNLAKDIAEAVDTKNLDRKWVRASMGIMTYEHEFQVLNHELERLNEQLATRQAEAAAIQAEIEATTARAEEMAARLEAATAQAEAATAQAEAATAQAEAEAARAEAATAQAEAEAARAEAATAQAEAEAARAETAQTIQRLSRKLYEAGRGNEYFAALDDPALMERLLAEFGL